MQLWHNGESCAGFSLRLPDYAIRFWLNCFEKAITQCPIGKFLDIGAGDGRLSQLLLHKYSPNGVAVEVQVNKEKWNNILTQYPTLELKVGLIQDWLTKFQGKYLFDLIILIEVFEHIPPEEIPSLLKNLYEILAINGMIFITTPNRITQGPAELSPIWHEKQPYGHYKHYTYEEIKNILLNAGFSIEWHTFECHWIKTIFYNKLFYPLSRLDSRLTHSRKIPYLLRKIYYFSTSPIFWIARVFFWISAHIIYYIEKNYGTQNSSATIMLLAKKVHE
jgi:SAM-dependent methyltransferase